MLRKGYGLAEVELGVPIQPDMVFRVGSVTKEFTSACVLLLAEQGRLRLDDDIAKYLPDYPAGGRRITIEQLLTHTSGIRSYTDMPAWAARMREDWTLAELVDIFKNEPFDFEPGTRWHYGNSGYVLLGAHPREGHGKEVRGPGLRDDLPAARDEGHALRRATSPSCRAASPATRRLPRGSSTRPSSP